MKNKVIKKGGLSKKSSVAKKKSKGSSKDATLVNLQQLIQLFDLETDAFVQAEGIDINMSSKERNRLISAGVRNNGFIDKAFDFAADYPRLMIGAFNLQDMQLMERRFELLRAVMLAAQNFSHIATTAFMVQADKCFHFALMIYDSLRAQAQVGTPEAKELFEALKSYFTHRRRSGSEPTEEELLRDFHSLIKGKKDGKIVVENVAPKTVAGVRKVVDEVSRGRRAVKATFEDEKK